MPDKGGAGEIAITPKGAFAYVADSGFNGRERVLVVDTATNTVATEVPVGVDPNGIAITPDGAFVYGTNDFADNVSSRVLRTSSRAVRADLRPRVPRLPAGGER